MTLGTRLLLSCTFVSLVSCSPRVSLPSLMNGSGQFVNCIFDASSVYRDIVFEFAYTKQNKETRLVFKRPEKEFKTRFLADTQNRLTIAFINDKSEEVLLNFFYDTGAFSMLNQKIEFQGKCEEIR